MAAFIGFGNCRDMTKLERTLYNWQTTAARLVAQHLRELHEGVS